jgi:hypothetical protein
MRWSRLEQLALKKGLDTDWAAARHAGGGSDGEDSTSSGDQVCTAHYACMAHSQLS